MIFFITIICSSGNFWVNDYKSETSFIDSAINLAKITPFEDFTQMIESLYDYQYNGKFYGSTVVPDSILNDIKNLGSSENLSKTSGSSYCNCRWTCIWHNDYNPSGGCSHTPDGCGFLWLQSCTGHYN